MQLGPFDQEPYVADKDNPWKRRDLLGWRRTRAYAQIRQLPPLHSQMPDVPPVTVYRSAVPWKTHDDEGNARPGPTTLLGCRLAASLADIGIDAEDLVKPLKSATDKGAVERSGSVWDECERQAITILEADHARYGDDRQTPAQVWESLRKPVSELIRESEPNSDSESTSESVSQSTSESASEPESDSTGLVDESESTPENAPAGLVENTWTGLTGVVDMLIFPMLFVVEVVAGIVLGVTGLVPSSIAGWSAAEVPIYQISLLVVVFAQLIMRRGVALPERTVVRPWNRAAGWAIACVWAVAFALAAGGILAAASAGIFLAVVAAAVGIVSSLGISHALGSLHSYARSVVFTGVFFVTFAVFSALSPAAGVFGAAVAVSLTRWVNPRGLVFALKSGGGIAGFWHFGTGDGWETHCSRYFRMDAEMWLDGRLRLAATGALSVVLGACGRVPIPASPRLVEVDKADLVPTCAVERVWADLGEHRTAAVAVVGERGLGKTTVIESVQDRCNSISRSVELDDSQTMPNAAWTIRLIVPGDYSAPDFISYAAREISEGVVAQAGRARLPGGWVGKEFYRYITFGWFATLTACVGIIHLWDQEGWAAWMPRLLQAVFLLALAGPAALVATVAIRNLQSGGNMRRQWWALLGRQLRARRAVMTAASNLRLDLRWLRRLSAGVSAEVSVGSDSESRRFFSHTPGAVFRAQQAEERTALTLTYAEIVRRAREVLKLYSRWAETYAAIYQESRSMSVGAAARIRRELGDHFSDFTPDVYDNMVPSLVVLVDEMDKIPDDERTAAINHIKDLFRIPHVKFVVTIADDYDAYRFMRYGMPQRGRDPYDSAFDDIVQVRACDPLTAMQLFTRRVPGFPAPLALLAFVLAAGHPRDMIRTARFALERFRRTAERLEADGLAVSEARTQALVEAIEATCSREKEEFVALVHSVEHPGQRPTRPWDTGLADQGVGNLSSAGAEAVRRMTELLDGTASFVRDYATDTTRGWATPDLVPGARTATASPDEPWRDYPVCLDAAELASERLAVIDQVRAQAVARQPAGGMSAARPAVRPRRLRGAR